MYHHLPNIITCARICGSVLLWYLIVIHSTWSAIILLTLGAVSDFYDGYLARRFAVTSELGVFLDPLADKIFILGGFGALWSIGIVAWWVPAVIAARDMLITVARTVLLRKGKPLKTLFLAKGKTVLQFTALYFFILGDGAMQGHFGSITAVQQGWLVTSLHVGSVVLVGVTLLTGFIYIPQIVRKAC